MGRYNLEYLSEKFGEHAKEDDKWNTGLDFCLPEALKCIIDELLEMKKLISQSGWIYRDDMPEKTLIKEGLIFKSYEPDVVNELRKCGCEMCKQEVEESVKNMDDEIYDKGAW